MKKIILISILTAISYAGIYFYAMYRFPGFVYECTSNPIDRDMFKNPKNYTSEEIKVFLSKTYNCVNEKQTWVERIVVSAPTKW